MGGISWRQATLIFSSQANLDVAQEQATYCSSLFVSGDSGPLKACGTRYAGGQSNGSAFFEN
jgi:hypothetical protein